MDGWADEQFPADPYPGAVPATSFVHLDATTYPLDPPYERHVDPRWLDGWAVRPAGTGLRAWLAAHSAPPLEGRVPLLAYGSNRCPSKITWLRRELGLGDDPVVVLRVRTHGVSAVWAAGLRHRDGQRPAVLAAAPGVDEEHAVWLATPEQVEVLDRCEGRDDRFRLVRLHTGDVSTGDGVRLDRPWCYTGHGVTRRPLLVDGAPVRTGELPQAAARDLVGEPGLDDGLRVAHVVGPPRPDDWPAALFVYGLLRPGQASWRLVAPHAAAPPRPATAEGAVFDTGRGYPAWLPDRAGRTPGVLVPLRDPAGLFPALDRYEGPQYERVRAVVDGTVCWAYAWRAGTAGLRPLPGGWR